MSRISDRFARVEPRRRVRHLMLGLLSDPATRTLLVSSDHPHWEQDSPGDALWTD
ncbi:hypothetical protein [Streptomyces sp. NPDC058678]|uniref:hypothetical protein n=1 Tax=Streptomyces sp. NPDC058678 TaxID=3346595 RepID=UPI0036548BAA